MSTTTEAKPTSPVAETAPVSSTPDASTGAAGDVSDTTAAVAPADVATGGAEGTQNEEADTNAEAGGAGAGVEIDVNAQLTVRALVSTKEAGVIIGKGGANVAELREKTGVKAGVSKVVQGVHDRVLSVTGTIDGVSRAYSHIANTILDNPAPAPTAPGEAAQPGPFTSVRLLISHNLMGTVIGRQGLKIKHIQDVSGARMVASKEMLPQSTERIVEVQGTTESIRVAVLEIAKCLLEDWERGQGTVQYQPGQVEGAGVLAAAGAAGPLQGGAQPGQGGGPRRPSAPYLGGAMNAMTLAGGPGAPAASGSGAARRSSPQVEGGAANGAPRRAPAAAADAAALAAGAAVTPGGGLVPGASAASLGGATLDAAANQRTQNISIPSDMVGCIIGKGGSKITEIRRLSGSRISIAKVPHDDTGERMFTIQGTPEANEKALFLLYNQLESEKERRTSTAHEEGSAEATAAAAAAGAAPVASPAAPAGGDEAVAA